MRRVSKLPLVAVAVLLVSSARLSAQTTTPEFGITAGPNMSTISGGSDGTAHRSYRYDFMAGASVIFPLNDMVSLQPELLYSRQGVKFTDTGFDGAVKLNYITIPVLFRFELGDAKA